MKSLQRPSTVTTPTRNLNSVLVQSRDEFIAFDKAWKLAVEADRNREPKMGHSIFAELSILRNIMLGRNIYTGFTPKLRQGNLTNGMGFMDGFTAAYRRLRSALERKTPSHLQHACHGLLLSICHWPTVPSLLKEMQDPSDFVVGVGRDVYIARVHNMIVKLQANDTSLQGMSYDEIFDLFDNEHQFNLITQDDFVAGNYDKRRMMAMLKITSKKYIERKLVGKNKDTQKIESVYIVDDPEWLYANSEGVDQRDDAYTHGTIAIHTIPAVESVTGKPIKHLIPVAYLWETKWLETK